MREPAPSGSSPVVLRIAGCPACNSRSYSRTVKTCPQWPPAIATIGRKIGRTRCVTWGAVSASDGNVGDWYVVPIEQDRSISQSGGGILGLGQKRLLRLLPHL